MSRMAFGLGCLLMTACASLPFNSSGRPDWAQSPARIVDAGAILHTGHGLNANEALATEAAQGQALQDIANECSFVPSSAHVRDRAITQTQTGHEAWVRIAVDFDSCERAKKATDPEEIRRLAHKEFTEEVRRYQEAQAGHELLSSLAATTGDEQVENPVAPPPAPIRDEIHFFAVRQQVVYAKQDVILSKAATAKAAESPALGNRMPDAVKTRVSNLTTYEEAHPEFKRSPRSWSNFGREAVLHSPWVNPLVRQPDPPVGKERAARWLNLRKPAARSTSRTLKSSKRSLKKKLKSTRTKKRW